MIFSKLAVCAILPLLASAAPAATSTSSSATSKIPSVPTVTASPSDAAQWCGVTGLIDGLSGYESSQYNSQSKEYDAAVCEKKCLGQRRCSSYVISVNSYANPAVATCYLFDVPTEVYITNRGWMKDAKPPSVINYFYDRDICFASKAKPTTYSQNKKPSPVTASQDVANRYCGVQGDAPNRSPYLIYSYKHEPSFSSGDVTTLTTQYCESKCLRDKKCLAFEGAYHGGSWAQCFFYDADLDTLGVIPDESTAYYWDVKKCFAKR